MLVRYPPSQCSTSNSFQVSSKLCRFGYEEVRDLLEKPSTVLVFLGVEKNGKPSSSTSVDEGLLKPAAWFAVGTDEDAAELLKRSREQNCSFPKIPNRDLLQLKEDEAGANPNLFGCSCSMIFLNLISSLDNPLRTFSPSSRSRGPGPLGAGLAQPLQLLPDVRQWHQARGGRIQEALPEPRLQEPEGCSQHLLPTSWYEASAHTYQEGESLRFLLACCCCGGFFCRQHPKNNHVTLVWR